MLNNWVKSHFNGTMLCYRVSSQLKLTGHIIELRKFGREFYVGSRPKTHKKEISEIDPTELPNHKLSQEQRFWRAKRKLHDIINCNGYAWPDKNGHTDPPTFATLTFADNIQDTKYANREYSKFIQRLNFMITGNKEKFLKYVVVIEFQKRGAIHYHVLFFNLPYIEYLKTKMADLWGRGYINIKSVDRVKNVAKYMSKYMSKEFDNPRLYRKRCYFPSSDLKQPRLVYFDDRINEILELIPKETMEFFSDTPTDGYIPLLEFTRFNLSNNPKHLKQILAFLDITSYDVLDTTPTDLDIESYAASHKEIKFPSPFPEKPIIKKIESNNLVLPNL